jgi:hypothetical protein
MHAVSVAIHDEFDPHLNGASHVHVVQIKPFGGSVDIQHGAGFDGGLMVPIFPEVDPELACGW